MAVTNYYSVNGQIIGEATNGVRTDYLVDALGSVTGTVNSACQVVNTYRYKPYGALLSKTGAGADPAFGWVGTQGYKQTQKKFSDFYVRARHYGSSQGRWTTKDPIGLEGGINLYSIVGGMIVSYIDKSGLLCSPRCDAPNGCNSRVTSNCNSSNDNSTSFLALRDAVTAEMSKCFSKKDAAVLGVAFAQARVMARDA